MKKSNLLILIGRILFMAGCSKDDVESGNAIVGKWHLTKYEQKKDCEANPEFGTEPSTYSWEKIFGEGNYFEFKASGDCILWSDGDRVESKYQIIENGTKIRFADYPLYIAPELDYSLSIEQGKMTLYSDRLIRYDGKCTGGEWIYLSK
ncbi:hypothetical protein [Leadbetterella sp. DM7]|uniref:hypothetical protein n=1 Tax=Leadbetterella sp. DM7 TaxID=3235085 RepID=UPI00349EC1CA